MQLAFTIVLHCCDNHQIIVINSYYLCRKKKNKLQFYSLCQSLSQIINFNHQNPYALVLMKLQSKNFQLSALTKVAVCCLFYSRIFLFGHSLFGRSDQGDDHRRPQRPCIIILKWHSWMCTVVYAQYTGPNQTRHQGQVVSKRTQNMCCSIQWSTPAHIQFGSELTTERQVVVWFLYPQKINDPVQLMMTDQWPLT